MQPADRLVADQPDDADGQNTREDHVRFHIALGRLDHIADPRAGGDDLGDDQIGPAPAEGDAEVVDHAGQHRRQNDVAQHGAGLGAHGHADFDILARHAPGIVGDQEHELEEGADPQQRNLRSLADAEPSHRQRHQRRYRQVPYEVDHRLADRVDDAVGAHEDAERDGQHGGQPESHADAKEADADVLQEAVVG